MTMLVALAVVHRAPKEGPASELKGYAKRAQEYHRQSVLIGSTNDSVYLRDQTGGRRFLPVKCEISGEIDTDRLTREVDQLWAEALHYYREMRVKQPHGGLPLYVVDPVAREIAERLQESRKVEASEDAFAGRIEAWLSSPIVPGGHFAPSLSFGDLPVTGFSAVTACRGFWFR